MKIRRRHTASRGPFQGSKHQARLDKYERRESDAFLRDLNSVRALASYITGRPHLEQILSKVPDEANRNEMRKLLLPMIKEA